MESFGSDVFLGHSGTESAERVAVADDFAMGDLRRRMASAGGGAAETVADGASEAGDPLEADDAAEDDGEIVVRSAEMGDIGDVIELAAEMAIHSMSPFRRPGTELIIADRREDLQSLYQTWWDPDTGIFVARSSSGRLLGHVLVKVGCKEFLTGEDQAWIFDLAVAPDHWGTGLAKRLMEAAEEFAAERGMGYLGLTVTCANMRAAKFYANMGYQDERVQMVKILNPIIPEEIQ